MFETFFWECATTQKVHSIFLERLGGKTWKASKGNWVEEGLGTVTPINLASPGELPTETGPDLSQ